MELATIAIVFVAVLFGATIAYTAKDLISIN